MGTTRTDEIQLAMLIVEYEMRCGGDDCDGDGGGANLPPPIIMPRLPGRGGGEAFAVLLFRLWV